jgi:hypothetical protein
MKPNTETVPIRIWNDELQEWESGWLMHTNPHEQIPRDTRIVSEEDSPAFRYVVDQEDVEIIRTN